MLKYDFRVLTFANLAADRSSLNGEVLYAVWQDYRNGSSDIFISKSMNRGANWSAPVSVTGPQSVAQNFFPEIDVDPLTGYINIVYLTNYSDGFHLDVYAARSKDGGTTFTNKRVTTTSFDPNNGGPPVSLIGDYIDVVSIPKPQPGYLAV